MQENPLLWQVQFESFENIPVITPPICSLLKHEIQNFAKKIQLLKFSC